MLPQYLLGEASTGEVEARPVDDHLCEEAIFAGLDALIRKGDVF